MTISSDKMYRLVSSYDSSKALEIDRERDSLRYGIDSMCKIGAISNDAAQVFFLVEVDSHYLIQSVANPRMHLAHDEQNGTRAHFFLNTTDYLMHATGFYSNNEFPATHLWNFESQANGTYVISSTKRQNEALGVDVRQGNFQYYCVMDVKDSSNSGQRWILQEVSPSAVTGKYYFPKPANEASYRLACLANANSVLTLDYSAHSVKLAPSSNSLYQQFSVVENSNGTKTFLSATNPPVALTAYAGGVRSPVVGMVSDGTARHQWRVIPANNVDVYLESNISSSIIRRLDFSGSTANEGTRCVLWHEESAGQQWAFETDNNTGYTRIRYSGSSLYLQIDNPATGDSAIAILDEVDGSSSQLFTCEQDDLGRIKLHSCQQPNYYLQATGLTKEFMVLGQPSGSTSIDCWYLEPTRGSAFEINPFESINACFCLDTMEKNGAIGENCLVRANQMWHTTSALSAQWLFEEILPALQSGVRICHIRVAEGSFASALQVGAVDGTGSYALTFAAADEEETDQQFEMHINSDGTRTFVSCTYPGYAITLTSQALNGAVKCSYMANGTPTDAQKWRCFQSVDGTYEIRSMADANWLLARTSSAGTGCNVASFDEESLLERWSITVLGEGEGGEPAGDPVYWNEKKLVYRIRNASATSLAVTLDAERPASGTVATMETVTNATNQLFEIQPHDDGSCTLSVCANRSLALTAAGTIGAGSAVQGVTDSGLPSQRWRLVRQHDGTFAIACRQDHYAWLLDIRDSGLQAGTSCTVQRSDGASSQKWTLEPVVVDTDGTYIQDGLSTVRIRNFSNTQTPIYAQLSSAAHAELSELARPNHLGFGVFNHNAAQVFNLNPQASGAYIESAQDPAEGQVLPLALTVDSLIQRAPVHGLTEGSASNQLWSWELQGDGTYLIKLLNSNSWYLDSTGFSAAASSFGMVWPTIGPDATHKWLFEPADESETPASGDWNIPSGPTTLYYIRNVCNNLVVLQFDTTPPANGCAMSTRYPSLGLNQLFEKQENDDGNDTVTFLSYPGRDVAMTATGYAYRDAVQGTSYQDPPTTAQKWVIDELGGGTTQIVCDGSSGMRLDTNGSTTEHLAGAIVWGYNGGTTQQWTFDEVEVLAPGTQSNPVYPVYPIVRIRSVDTSTVAAEVKIDSQTNAKPVRTVTVASSDRQKFMMRANNDGTVTFISVAAPTLALTAKNLYNRGDVTAETLDSSENAAYQKWTIQLKTDGTYHIVSAYNSAWRLDIDGPSAENGSYCCMWQENTGTAQKWVIEYVAIVGE